MSWQGGCTAVASDMGRPDWKSPESAEEGMGPRSVTLLRDGRKQSLAFGERADQTSSE